jgi:hypothetical protein
MPPSRSYAIAYMLHLLAVSMFICTTACGRNSLVMASILLRFFWTCVRPPIRAIHILYVETCNSLGCDRLPSLLRFPESQTAQTIWPFHRPVATLPLRLPTLRPEDLPGNDSRPVYDEAPVRSVSSLIRVRPDFPKTCLGIYTDSYVQLTFRFSGYASIRCRPESGRYSGVRNPPLPPTQQEIWHCQRDPNSPRDELGRQKLIRVIPHAWDSDLLWAVRYIPEWSFIVCYPTPRDMPLFMFSIFPAKARLGQDDWLCGGNFYLRNDDSQREVHMKMVLVFLWLIRIDQLNMADSQDSVSYLHGLVERIAARIDALQQCCDILSRLHTATDV